MKAEYHLAEGADLLRMFKAQSALPSDRVHAGVGPLPDALAIASLKVGEGAKLAFMVAKEGELAWVTIRSRAGNRFSGTLDKDLVKLPMKAGDLVEFGPKHIAGVL
jgi:hypothetical protein